MQLGVDPQSALQVENMQIFSDKITKFEELTENSSNVKHSLGSSLLKKMYAAPRQHSIVLSVAESKLKFHKVVSCRPTCKRRVTCLLYTQ